MTSIRNRFITTLFVFLVVVISGTACGSKKERVNKQSSAMTSVTQSSQNLHLSIPDAEWVPAFFKFLDVHIEKIGLPSLKTVVLPNKDDLEVRFWGDLLPDNLDGIVLRRAGNQWSAVRISGKNEGQSFPLTQEWLARPKSGWDRAWEKLVGADILTLPDASEVKCNVISVDGLGFVIETNYNWIYRTYYYRNPQRAECNEAKRVISIIQVLFDEFGLKKI